MSSRRPLLVGLVLAAAVGSVVVALLLKNGGEEGGEQAGSGPVATTTTTATTGFLVVDQKLERFVFREGAFSYVRLEADGSGVVVEKLIRDARRTLPLLRQRLAPGRYRLLSHQRPCEGVCPGRGSGGLDPPTGECTTTFEIEAGEMLTATVRPVRNALKCTVVFGERVSRAFAQRRGFRDCRRAADDPAYGVRPWAKYLEADSTRSKDVAAAYAEMTFRGFEPGIREGAAEGCAEGIETIEEPIRFDLEETYPAGDKIAVAIENVGRRAYVFQFYYQACFLSYFDSSGRRFIIPPGTHCDLLAEETIRPGERKRLFTWKLDECVKDEWGCGKSRPLPPGTYTIEGRFEPKASGTPVRVEATFGIVARGATI